MRRRDFFKKAGIGSAALVSLPAFADALTRSAFAQSSLKKGQEPPDDTFVILLQGTYAPVVRCPDLGLLQVDLCDGSYSTVKIHPVNGLPDEEKENGKTKKAIGNFYVQLGGGGSAVYDLPGGALAMVFSANHTVGVSDGHGGTFVVGTFELNIIEATGIYESFAGGHNVMSDNLHVRADGTIVEYCYCVISRS
jgi:hypothetical protein